MKDRWRDGLRALSRFSEIEWFGISTESNSVYGYLQVPRMKWRFKDRSEHTARLIEGVVKDAPTQVEWTLDRTRRNWVLLPSRIILEAQGLEGPAYSDVIHRIAADEQDFCRKALSDFDEIVTCLQEVVMPETRPGGAEGTSHDA